MFSKIWLLIFILCCTVFLSSCTLYSLDVVKNNDKTNTVKAYTFGCEDYLPDIYIDEADLSVWQYCPYGNKGQLWKVGPVAEEVDLFVKNLPDKFKPDNKVNLQKCGDITYEKNFTDLYCGESSDAGYKFKLWKDTKGIWMGLRSKYNYLEYTTVTLSSEARKEKAKLIKKKKEDEAKAIEAQRQKEEKERQVAEEKERQERLIREEKERQQQQLAQEEQKRQTREETDKKLPPKQGQNKCLGPYVYTELNSDYKKIINQILSDPDTTLRPLCECDGENCLFALENNMLNVLYVTWIFDSYAKESKNPELTRYFYAESASAKMGFSILESNIKNDLQATGQSERYDMWLSTKKKWENYLISHPKLKLLIKEALKKSS
ncbi:MAG: hypothetical protein BWY38_02724 [Ignavibacteria bacterium ADurb.Bin266]|nr:MAG: hypothetical protein BWY38_02724 [Ignavibacteria bacterium ADurb.Bin266]